ncbi:carbohydrate ABC transporter permease [Asanoa iriomotensis]|uniref:Sugar-binding protein n=1 Tax=Asanoa iriomotensis TaxID=234613 RepID=A0ABQ4C007_9ACTN|nr:sugar ABC transporter permease [Asanoa iriomotensis]GIF56097.1 sugar-binding protein [Asanoa iriomotensis]
MTAPTVTVPETAPATRTGGRPRRRSVSRRTRLIAWLFMVPLIVVNVTVILWPGAQSVYYSFTDWSGIGTGNWIGFGNYTRMLHDEEFISALKHNLVWTVVSLIAPMLLALLGAYLLSRVRRFQVLFRLAYFIPYTVATVVSAAVWENLLSPDSGLGNLLGVNFLGDQDLALGTVAGVNTWAFWGFLVVIFLASMQSVNPALYEAAALDGAGPFRQFVSITLPSIRPTLVFLVVQTIVWSFLAFDFVFILTQGGPAGATDVLSTLLYRNAFSNLEAGYASAIGVVMALFTAIVVITYQVLRRVRKWEA